MTYKMWKWIGDKLSYGGRYSKEIDTSKEKSKRAMIKAFKELGIEHESF